MVEQDARLSFKDIASCSGISEGSVQTILRKRLNLRKVYAKWVPHLLFIYFSRLGKRLQKCVSVKGEYFEGL